MLLRYPIKQSHSINLTSQFSSYMKEILLLGAGRSSAVLIDYLLENSQAFNWALTIADKDINHLKESYHENDRLKLIEVDLLQDEVRNELVKNTDLVISMLPARFHILVAKSCVQFKVNMATASYVSKEMKALQTEVENAGIVFLNELGVDPGIDHLSAKKVLDAIQDNGGKIEAFETFTGGLLAPESDTNPWNYKFTWNPRNVVLAGQGGAVKFLQEGTYKYIPYNRLFRRTEKIHIDGYGFFEGIANRDSLKYRSIYGLEDIKTMYRGTLRRPGFCRAWDAFIQLGLTDDSFVIEKSEELTFRSFVNLFLPYNPHDSVELKLQHYLNLAHDDIDLFEKLKWLDLFEEIKVGIKDATPAQVLQHILERKWKLEEEDKDMIVMWHKFVYSQGGKKHELHSSMVVKGENQRNTAMAKTVGLPLAIGAKMILNGEIKEAGVHVPIAKSIYEPILKELATFGIVFTEKVVE